MDEKSSISPSCFSGKATGGSTSAASLSSVSPSRVHNIQSKHGGGSYNNHGVTQESTSTSSNEDDVFLCPFKQAGKNCFGKPMSSAQPRVAVLRTNSFENKRDLRRKKLHKRSKRSK